MSCSDTSNDAVVESSVVIAKFVLNIDCAMLTLDLGYPWIDEHIRIDDLSTKWIPSSSASCQSVPLE